MHYVYRLIDPRNGETFYVGKGLGNRVFAHVKGELDADADSLTDKRQRIRDIRRDGFEVIHVVHRHGMDEATSTRDAQSRETGLELGQEPAGTMDWSDCPLVEVKPGVQRGRPVLKGTRMPADDIIENWEAGLDEPDIAANFRLPIAQVRAILSYAADHQDAPHPVR
jgi:uncharacterized protein (DUF433 family)